MPDTGYLHTCFASVQVEFRPVVSTSDDLQFSVEVSTVSLLLVFRSLSECFHLGPEAVSCSTLPVIGCESVMYYIGI